MRRKPIDANFANMRHVRDRLTSGTQISISSTACGIFREITQVNYIFKCYSF